MRNNNRTFSESPSIVEAKLSAAHSHATWRVTEPARQKQIVHSLRIAYLYIYILTALYIIRYSRCTSSATKPPPPRFVVRFSLLAHRCVANASVCISFRRHLVHACILTHTAHERTNARTPASTPQTCPNRANKALRISELYVAWRGVLCGAAKLTTILKR